MKKILFYPVTCNPPHLGHISTVMTALSNINFDEVWILPSGKRVDKEIPTSPEHRREMGNLLVQYLQTQTNVPVKLITTALDENDNKYTHEVIVEIKSESQDEIFQLAGTDGYSGIKERVIGPNEKFVIVKRAGYELPADSSVSESIIILDGASAEISSTQIREMVKNHDIDYKKLVPEKISDYIEKNKLYLV